MTGHVTGTGICAGLAENLIIADPGVLLAFEHLAPLRWPRRQLPAGALLVPCVEHLGPAYQPGHKRDDHDQDGQFGPIAHYR